MFERYVDDPDPRRGESRGDGAAGAESTLRHGGGVSRDVVVVGSFLQRNTQTTLLTPRTHLRVLFLFFYLDSPI